MNSFTDFTGTAGCTESTSGTVVVWMIGAKSRIGSKGTLSTSGRTEMLLAVPMTKV